jgi:hypothetical protein
MAMGNIAKWILSTVLLTGLMVGLGLILLLLAIPLSQALLKRYAVHDDWCIFALPSGAVVGLILGVRYRGQIWLRVFAGIMLVFAAGYIISLFIPYQVPDSMPEGMNRLPIAMGNMIREALLRVVLITGILSLAVAAVTNSILYLVRKHESRPFGVS